MNARGAAPFARYAYPPNALGSCGPADASSLLRERFRSRAGTRRDATGRARAHHSFQVFDVCPWTRLLVVSGHPTALSVLGRCRIRTGVDRAVRAERAEVASRPLLWTGGRLAHGAARRESVRWSTGGGHWSRGSARGSGGPALGLGTRRLTESQAARVEAAEARQLAAQGLAGG